MIKNFVTITVLSVLATFLIAGKANAISVSPAKRILTIDAHTEREVSLKVRNDETTVMTLKPSVIGLKQDQAGRAVFGAGFDDAEQWVVPQQTAVSLSPGQTKEVFFTITVPKGAFPGAHWVGLAVESLPDEDGSAVLSKQVISLLSIQVSGVVSESVSIETELTRRFLVVKNETTLHLALENNGTIEVPLKGSVVVRDLRKQEIARINFTPGNQLLPQAARLIDQSVVITSALPPFFQNQGKFNRCLRENSATFCLRLTWPGLYTLSTAVTYGKTQQVVYSEESFWYLPIWSLGLVAVILILIGIVARVVLRRKTIQKYVA